MHWLYESLGYCSQFSFKLIQCGAPLVQYTSVGCILQVPGRPRDKKLAAISEQIMSAAGCCLHTWWLGWGTWPLLSKWSRRIPKWLGGSLKRSVSQLLDRVPKIKSISFFSKVYLITFLCEKCLESQGCAKEWLGARQMPQSHIHKLPEERNKMKMQNIFKEFWRKQCSVVQEKTEII